jgi:hypothetical protein
LGGALHLRHLALRFTFRSNSFSAVRYFPNQFARAFFKIGNCALRDLLKTSLTFALALRCFLVE